MLIAAWIIISIEIILLLVWIYSLYFTGDAPDPAGSGMLQFLLILAAAYIGLGIYFLQLGKTWSMIVAMIMGLIPELIILFKLRAGKTMR